MSRPANVCNNLSISLPTAESLVNFGSQLTTH